MLRENYPFRLLNSPYEYSALEPVISKETMSFHHDKHLKAYTDKLNLVLKDYPEYQNWNLIQLLSNLYSMPIDIRDNVRNNAGGVFNHRLYFDIINPNKTGREPVNILKAIKSNFGSMSEFVKIFKDSAKSVFGSGYTFLVINKNNKLNIINTKNQDSVFELNLYPLMLIDLWEHAYYLDYQNRRDDYIENFMKIINLEKVEERYIKYFNYR